MYKYVFFSLSNLGNISEKLWTASLLKKTQKKQGDEGQTAGSKAAAQQPFGKVRKKILQMTSRR